MKVIDFRKLPLKQAMVIRQTLTAAMASTDTLPVMFCLVDNATLPTEGQIVYSREILSNVLNNWVVEYAYHDNVISCLSYMLVEFTDFYDENDDTADMPGPEYLMRMFGIDFTDAFRDMLQDFIDEYK